MGVVNILIFLLSGYWTPLIGGSDVTTTHWMTTRLPDTLDFPYYVRIVGVSRVRCVGVCWQMFTWNQVYWRDGTCYCLAPVDTPVSQVDGKIPLDLIHQSSQDISLCTERGYTTMAGEDYCYKTVTAIQKTWTDAADYCIQDGGQLMSADTTDKFEALRGITAAVPGIYLLGGYLPDGETDMTRFVWLNGRPMNNSFWAATEPNNPNEHVTEYVTRLRKLNNIFRDVPRYYVCEILI